MGITSSHGCALGRPCLWMKPQQALLRKMQSMENCRRSTGTLSLRSDLKQDNEKPVKFYVYIKGIYT